MSYYRNIEELSIKKNFKKIKKNNITNFFTKFMIDKKIFFFWKWEEDEVENCFRKRKIKNEKLIMWRKNLKN